MKRLLVFLAILAMASSASAADPTTEMLNAPLVQDYITLSLGRDGGKTIVRYTLDSGASSRSADGRTFRSSDQIAIHIKDFNPLTQAWVVDSKATPDVSYTAIKAFFDDLSALQKALAPAGGAGTGTPGEDRTEEQMEALTGCAKLLKLIRDAHDALSEQALSASELQSLVSGATGNSGVTNAESTLALRQNDIVSENTAAREALDSIRSEFGTLHLEKEDALPRDECTPINSRILVDYIQVNSTADQIIAAKEQLHAQIGDLRKSLQPYLERSEWHGKDLADYRIRSVTPTFAEQQEVSVSAKRRIVTLDGGSLSVTTDDANVISGKFTVRKSSFFVAERAAAVIYNNLTYPQYGTTTNDNGETVVERVDDHDPINGALMLNLVTRLPRTSVAHPLLQLGVSSAKDFPGFLAGVGLRFVEPFNFSISVGGMITRYKDLDGDLREGDPVSGTADIEKHLEYKTSDVKLYGAIQVKF